MQATAKQTSLKTKSSMSAAAAKEAAAALRAQLQIELQNKKQCAYQPHECTQLTLDGYNYCLRHILEDKTAPYKQCAYVYTSNGKKCYLPAPKGDKNPFGYCNEHALKAHLSRTRQGTRYPPPRTAEVLLNSLSHYVKRPRSRTVSSSTQCSDDGQNTEENEDTVTKSLDPFVDVDAYRVNASCSDILDMCSESESDVEASTYLSVWHDVQGDSSDNESIDSEQEDVLKHCNVYTAEEITQITRDKLIRLQSLYVDQYRHLQHVLKERRRRYVQALKREKESCCSVHNQMRDNPKEQRLYKKLKAYNSYHKKHGTEGILSKRVNEMRSKLTDGLATKPPAYSKCAFTEGGVKCGERALPVARHCRKHVLEDPNQVLFRSCGKMQGDMECSTPVEVSFNDATCRLHLDIPALRSYSEIRHLSESDFDDSMENKEVKKSTATLRSQLPKTKVTTQMITYGSFAAANKKKRNLNSRLFRKTGIKQENIMKDGDLFDNTGEIEMSIVSKSQLEDHTCQNMDTGTCNSEDSYVPVKEEITEPETGILASDASVGEVREGAEVVKCTEKPQDLSVQDMVNVNSITLAGNADKIVPQIQYKDKKLVAEDGNTSLLDDKEDPGEVVH